MAQPLADHKTNPNSKSSELGVTWVMSMYGSLSQGSNYIGRLEIYIRSLIPWE